MSNIKVFQEQKLPTQAEIIAHWTLTTPNSPLVSIICTSFQQENYIKDTLKGFLTQVTDFPFEIIIHDDASVDKTADIINDYAQEYPLLIKPILQKKNQYSINRHLPLINTISAANGEYLALCEGDDFWICCNKLQTEVHFLQNSSEYSFVFSPAQQLSNNQVQFIRNAYRKKFIESRDLNWVLGAGGGFFPTCSATFRKVVIDELPYWFTYHSTGDYPLSVLARLHGKVGYIDRVMTVYRSHDKSISHKKYSSRKAELSQARDKFKNSIAFFNALNIEGIINSRSYYKLIEKELYILVRRDYIAGTIKFWEASTLISNFKYRLRFFAATLWNMVN